VIPASATAARAAALAASARAASASAAAAFAMAWAAVAAWLAAATCGAVWRKAVRCSALWTLGWLSGPYYQESLRKGHSSGFLMSSPAHGHRRLTIGGSSRVLGPTVAHLSISLRKQSLQTAAFLESMLGFLSQMLRLQCSKHLINNDQTETCRFNCASRCVWQCRSATCRAASFAASCLRRVSSLSSCSAAAADAVRSLRVSQRRNACTHSSSGRAEMTREIVLTARSERPRVVAYATFVQVVMSRQA
jgi:hypothetical protein